MSATSYRPMVGDGPLLTAAILAVAFSPVARPSEVAAPLPPEGLLVDLLDHPDEVVVAAARPQFSWIVRDDRRGARQTAWQIELVAAGGDGPVREPAASWDSGKVASAESVAVPYDGPPLDGETGYTWRVRTWDAFDVASPWSRPHAFRTAAGPPQAPSDEPTPEAYQATAGRSGLLVGRPRPVPCWEEPVAVMPLGPGAWCFDFGLAAFGTLEVRWERPPAGAELTVELGEKLAAEAGDAPRLDPRPPGSVRYQRHRLRLDPAATIHEPRLTWTPPGWMTEGYLTVPAGTAEVMPFRYAVLTDAPPGFEPAMVRRRSLAVPFDDTAAAFSCSRPGVTRIWELCRHTVRATTFAGLYVDGDRERKPYEADAFVNQLAHANLDRSYAVARHTLDYLLDRPTWPLEWQPFTVLAAWDDYLHTGDRRLLEARYDRLAVKTLRALARDDGLIDASRQTPDLLAALRLDTSLKIVVDWPPVERDGHRITPVDAVANAFHFRAVVLMGRIADAVGRPAAAADWHRRADRIRGRYHEVFFDPRTGRYRDGEGVEHGSLHASLFPLAFDLVPEPHRQRLRGWLRERGLACSVYVAHFLLEELARHGDPQAAIELVDAHGPRSWHGMIEQGATMTTEAWSHAVKPNQDWNHPWATGPAAFVGRHVVGVQPLEPGFRRIRVAPRPGDLERFDARIPTIRGPVRLSWRREAAAGTCELELPANAVVEFDLPGVSWAAVQESGRPVLGAAELPLVTSAEGRQVLELIGGRYEFSFSHASSP